MQITSEEGVGPMIMTGIEDWPGKGQKTPSSGNLEDAKRELEMALTRDPCNAMVLNELSMVYWQLGNVDAALNYLTRALEYAPNDREVIRNCCEVFMAMGRSQDAEEILEAYIARNPWDSAIRQTLEPRSFEPDSAEVKPFDIARLLTEQGEQQFEKGRLDRARACFEIALEHNPNHAKAHSNLGVLSYQENDLEQALAHLHQALELDPDDFDVLYNSSKALAAAGEIDAASDLLKLYLQKNPRDEAGWSDFRALQRQDGASSWKPNGLPKEVADTYLAMGKKLAQASDRQGASEAFVRALTIDPEKVEAYFGLGRLHQELDQQDEALQMFGEALRINAGHKGSVAASGEVLIQQGKLDDAAALFRSFLADHKDREIEQALRKIATASPSSE